jgi:hypothetical protein
MKLHQHFEFGPASLDPFSFSQIQIALDTVQQGVILYVMDTGHSMPPSLTDRTVCLGLGLLSC